MANPKDERSIAFWNELLLSFPRMRLVHKTDSRFCRLLDALLRIITVGKQSAFMDRYTTTIGRTIYVETAWDDRSDEERYLKLRHETVHLRQFERYGLIPMALMYLFPVFPIGLAYGRAFLEWEAYAETIRATAEVHGLDVVRDRAFQDAIRVQFTGAAYAWMWPFPKWVQRRIDETIEQLEEAK